MKNWRAWSPLELEYLREHFPAGDLDAIAAAIMHPKRTIYVKARELAIKRLSPGMKGKAMPVGSFSVLSDGQPGWKYLWQRVSNTGNYKRDWKRYHRVVWERERGAVPAGKFIVFKPGRRTLDPAKITIENLECITRRESGLRAGEFNRLPEPLREVAALRRKLVWTIRRKSNRAKQDRRSTQSPVRNA